MFLRIVSDSFVRSPRRKALTGAALALGMAIATATLTVALDVGDRLAREFRSLGANLLVSPKADTLPLEVGGVDYRPVSEGAYLPEADLRILKTIFWRNNIVGFAPILEVPVQVASPAPEGALRPPGNHAATLVGTWHEHEVRLPDGSKFAAGAAGTNPWWSVKGRWFSDAAAECMVGEALAQRAGIRSGDTVYVSARESHVALAVTGVLTTGGPEDEAVVAPIRFAQELSGHPGQYRRLYVSALTKPEDDFARRDPAAMTPAEYDRWFCTPYVSSIARQIEQGLPGVQARPIRRIAEGEGRILSRVSALMWLVTLGALVAAALAVGATSATTVLERRTEIGLMKAIGAGKGLVGSFFLAEQMLLAVVGGGMGYGAGIWLARWLGQVVFGVAPEQRLILLPVALVMAALVALVGSLLPLRRAAAFEPAPILRGE